MKKKIFYILLFLLFLVWSLLLQPLNLDEIWNYGFAHNIYSGLIPYKDFNMVLTPFYPFLMSLPFHIFGSNMLVFHIENAIILTILVYLITKLISKNYFIIGLFLFFPLSITFPSYNVFLFFLLVCILCLEKYQKSDYLIGFLLALSVLTKQSVGLFLLLPSLFYLTKKDKLLKRIVGFIIPITIFILTLLLTHSFSSFFLFLYFFFFRCFFYYFSCKNNGCFFCLYFLFFFFTNTRTKSVSKHCKG